MPRRSQRDAEEAFTVRLEKTLAERFKKQRKLADRTISDIGAEAIETWLERQEDPAARGVDADTAIELRDSIQKILVTAVTNHLRSKTDWAEQAINAASLMDPAISLYIQRVHHFFSEKRALSEHFVPWLVSRILHHVSQSRNVCLVVESGTTLKAILDDLAGELQKRDELQSLRADQILIVTNNFPGAESYEATANKFTVSGRALSDLVPCNLVPGRALREYSAVVGHHAEDYLRASCQQAPKAPERVRIGLVVGNWVMLEGNPARPIPLARGKGHKSFKEALLENCDEIFLITPLCKMIEARYPSAQQSLDEFNRDLFEGTTDEKGPYERVEGATVDSLKDRLKVVTTARKNDRSIVHPHSLVVSTTLRARVVDSYASEASKPIEHIPHIIFPHDTHSNNPDDEQLAIELPHKRTRTPKFRETYFHVTR